MNNYIRVTEALSPFSGYNKINPYVLKNASDRGSKVHDICSAIMDEIGMEDFEPRFDGYIISFNKWRNNKKFIERPPRLYCDKYMITGEIDGIYEQGKDLVLIDIKTSLKENKTWFLQGSAYAYLCRKHGYDVNRIEFIQLSKNGEDAKIYVYEENFEMFLKCLDLYKFFFQSCTNEDYLEDI